VSFQFVPLAAESFSEIAQLDDAALVRRHAHRLTADAPSSYPCRVSLRYAERGDPLLLLNYAHQTAASPYRASGPIVVRTTQPTARFEPGEVPDMLRAALLSVRGYGPEGWIEFADVTEGRDLEATIARTFKSPGVDYLHLHFARHGCYVCRIDRTRAAGAQ
jgi:hypothetical protein